jgi:chromosome segregation ATPase
MKIEDELRTQLNAALHEKDAADKKLSAEKKETDRLMDDFYRQKEELTSRNTELTNKLGTITNERDSFEREAKSLHASIESLEDQLQSFQEEVRKCHEKAERADSNAIALKEVAAQHAEELESTRNDLEDLNRVIDLERIAHANAVSDQQATYESELDQERLASKSCKERLEVLIFQNKSLEESIVSLRSRISYMEKAKSKQAEQIVQLKKNLNEALTEAIRLGSKVNSDRMRHLEITQTLSMFQEENSDLKHSLTGAEHEKSLFNDSVSKLSIEKNRLEKELSDKEKQLLEALNSLTHFELKLVKLEQERDRRDQESTEAREDIRRLHQVKASLERENEQLTGQISILQQGSKVDTLYKELLDKIKVKDMQREEDSREMKAIVDSLRARLATVTQEKKNLEVINNEKVSALQSNLASIKEQLLKKQKSSDEASTTSARTSKSYLKQTVVDLEESVDAMKKHYENKVRGLQHSLDDARKKMEEYERKISELSTLLMGEQYQYHQGKLLNNRSRPQTERSAVRSSGSEETVDSDVSY